MPQKTIPLEFLWFHAIFSFTFWNQFDFGVSLSLAPYRSVKQAASLDAPSSSQFKFYCNRHLRHNLMIASCVKLE